MLYTASKHGPLEVFGPESVAADLLKQVRWRDDAPGPRCCSDPAVRNGSYGHFQRYLCKDCDRTFNDKTGTIFAHSKITLHKWLFSIYASLRFNASLRQLQCEIGVTYKTVHRRAERLSKALDVSSIDLRGPIKIDEFYVSAGLKCRERDRGGRALAASLYAGAERTRWTSYPSLWSLIAVPITDMSWRRNPQMNQRFPLADGPPAGATHSLYR